MHFLRISVGCILAITAFVLAGCSPSPSHPPDPVQIELDRFVDLIADGMWTNGRVTTISAKPEAMDEDLIAATLQQLNTNPGPVKEWRLLKKLKMGPVEFAAYLHQKHPEQYPPGTEPGGNGQTYLIAVVDSDQGRKIMAINEALGSTGGHWARMYNCDTNFSSPQEGGTPLIR